MADPPSEATGPPAGGEPRRSKPLTIGAVSKALKAEFPDISISKIRYLEDQKLLTPRRTEGGYRLYTSGDVARLRTILRLQRDEFLPLRVIRQELAAGRTEADVAGADGTAGVRRPGTPRRSTFSMQGSGEPATTYSLEEVCEDTGADATLVRELEEFGIIGGTPQDPSRPGRRYDDTEREVVRAAHELARYGVGGRNLRVFRSSAEREGALLQAILGPALRSRNPERRREAVEALENLAATASHLKHLLLVRDLRRLAGG